MRGNNTMLTSDWHIFVQYLSSMLIDFHGSFIIGESFNATIKMRGNKYANFKTAHF